MSPSGNKGTFGLLLAVWSIGGSSLAWAHPHGMKTPPCFEWRDERVVPLADTSSLNSIVFGTPEVRPPNKTFFEIGEQLSVKVRISGQLCSPFSIILLSPASSKTALIQQTSPSIVYPPGKIDLQIQHYMTFAVDPRNPKPNEAASIKGLLLVVVQYASDRELASLPISADATWRSSANLSAREFPEYECIDDLRLSPAVSSNSPRCTNSIDAPSGSTDVDLNQDGICERVVRDAACDKLFGNRCYRVVAERSGDWQPIAQFYNELKQHQTDSVYRALSSIETGPKSSVTHFNEWRDGAYLHHMYLHNCDLLPQ